MQENTHEQGGESDLIIDVLRHGDFFTWPQYAERHNINSADAACQRWKRYARKNGIPVPLPKKPPPDGFDFEAANKKLEPPFDGFEVRKFNTGKNGEITTTSYGKEPPPQPPINFTNLELDYVTFNPNGQPWPRFKATAPPLEELTEHQRTEFEARRSHLETLDGSHFYQNAVQPGKTENWVIVGCAHFPGHNRKLWYGLLKYISTHKVDGFIFAGDAFDLRSLSAHDKGQVRDVTLWAEYEQCHEPLNELHQVLPLNCKKIFLYGNHCDRFNRVLKDAENSRFGDALLSPERAMKLPENGWTILRNWKEDYISLTPTLDVFHGNRLGDNPAQKELRDCILSGRSAIFFHTHRYGIATNGHIASYNCGMLGDIDNSIFGYVSWRVRQHWQNGFALASVLDDGSAFVNAVRCSRSGFVLDGSFYGG